MKMLRFFMVAALVVAVSAGAASAQTSWTDTSGGDWGDSGNWNPNVPTATDDATFNLSQDPAYTVNMNVDGVCANFIVEDDKVNISGLGPKTLTAGGNAYIAPNGDTATLTMTGDGFDVTAPWDPDTGVVDATFLNFSVAYYGIGGTPGTGTFYLNNALLKSTGKLRVGSSGVKAEAYINSSLIQIHTLYMGDNTSQNNYLELTNGSRMIITGGGEWIAIGMYGSTTSEVVFDDSVFTAHASHLLDLSAEDANVTGILRLRNGSTWDGDADGTNGQYMVGAMGTGVLEVTGSGTDMHIATALYLGGNYNTGSGGPKNTVGDVSAGTGTVTVGDGAKIRMFSDYAENTIFDVIVFNNNSAINMNGGTLTTEGSLMITGAASGSNGALNFQFSNPDHGRVILSETGQSADITKIGDAPLGFSFLGGGNAFVPTTAGCMDFIVAETITGFLTNAVDAAFDNMDELLAAANGGAGYPSYAYGIVTIDSDDYVGGAYDGYKALRLSVLPADADLGGLCDGADLLTWQNGYTNGDTTWDKGDYNLSGLVDGPDLLIWQNNYGKTLGDCSGMGATGAAAAVPEPMTLCLLGLGAVALIRRRR